MSIPVIGTAVVNSTKWVTRLLESVDYPVDNFVIINNNGRGQLDSELDALKAKVHPFVKKITVTHMPANLGVPGTWNLIIKCYMNAPFWIIVNDDISFGTGFLKEMYEKAMSDVTIGLIHGHEGDFGVGSWDLFLIRDTIIKIFGLFDENLYPAYNEDADYFLRFMHNPINKVLSLSSMYYHGNGEKGEYHKEGSQTQKTEPDLEAKLDYSNDLNIEYLTNKWGKDWRYCNPSKQPFGSYPISYTSYDLDFVRKKHLGF